MTVSNRAHQQSAIVSSSETPSPSPATDRKSQARLWADRLAEYKTPVTSRSVGQLAITLLALVALVVLMGFAMQVGYWLTLLLAVPAGFFLVRVFILQHDCGHGSFFRAGWANDLVGRLLGVLTVTPYEVWRRDHAIHHATSGNLDKRGTGDIDTLTVREYLALSPWGRLRYRIYRHPAVLFGIGPAFLFLCKFRIPLTGQYRDLRAWVSCLSTNAMIAAGLAVFMALFGIGAVLKVWLPVVVLGATIGIWMFYVQHQFEGVYWRRQGDWDFHEAALEGCSFYDLPRWLHWLTGYIGYHHVHHLASRVPNYRLRDCHMAIPDFQKVCRVGIWDSFKTVRLALFDEETRRLIGFSDLRARMA